MSRLIEWSRIDEWKIIFWSLQERSKPVEIFFLDDFTLCVRQASSRASGGWLKIICEAKSSAWWWLNHVSQNGEWKKDDEEQMIGFSGIWDRWAIVSRPKMAQVCHFRRCDHTDRVNTPLTLSPRLDKRWNSTPILCLFTFPWKLFRNKLYIRHIFFVSLRIMLVNNAREEKRRRDGDEVRRKLKRFGCDYKLRTFAFASIAILDRQTSTSKVCARRQRIWDSINFASSFLFFDLIAYPPDWINWWILFFVNFQATRKQSASDFTMSSE